MNWSLFYCSNRFFGLDGHTGRVGNIRVQRIFIAVYACFILAFAGTMSCDKEEGEGEERRLPFFFLDKRACKIHMAMSKRCRGATVKKVTVLTRPCDLLAGGTAAMGPCPAPQHQPPGLIMEYVMYIP